MFAPFTQFTSATPFFGDPGSVVCFDEFVSLVYLLLVLSFTRVKLYSFWPFLSDFLHSVEYSQDPPHVVPNCGISCFPWLGATPLCEKAESSLPSHPLVDIQVVSTSQLL